MSLNTAEFLAALFSVVVISFASGYGTYEYLHTRTKKAYCAEATALAAQEKLEIPAILADCERK